MKISESKKQVLKSLATYLLVFIFGVAGASLFWYSRNINIIKSLSTNIKPLRQYNNPYQFINPLLGYEVPGDVKEFNEYKALEQTASSAVKKQNWQGLENYAVYFRDLSLGRWMGINETDAYPPASMMKVAIMIAYFKQAEANPGILKQNLKYSSSTADQINGIVFETPSNLEVGKQYTVEQLIETMIITSDNGAKNALLDNLDKNNLDDVFTDLGVPNPDNNENYEISPKQYSLLLRVLYNATYLNRQYSEQALNIMSKAEYDQGLVAGLPKGTAIAQKFGENVNNSNPENLEISLSNCGIVYRLSHPYILCIMTKGKNIDTLTKTISLISKTVWDEINAYALSQNY